MGKAIIVLSFNTTAEELPDILSRINPPRLPGFTGEARIAFGPEAKYVETWLDDDDEVANLALSPETRQDDDSGIE